jgi:hypothetical protein
MLRNEGVPVSLIAKPSTGKTIRSNQDGDELMLRKNLLFKLLPFLLLVMTPTTGLGYSVLTHEAIIDSAWGDLIRPLILSRYPDASDDALREAHAYAYGGCLIQDVGYYPFSNKFFSDLVHCVRSGDFVESLIRESQNLNEFAFALGALAHYCADSNGHAIAVNRSVPLLYKKLAEKFGDEVSFADNPKAHLRLEFGFDVWQVARGHYGDQAYRDFIGFKVSRPVLERAFLETYGLDLKEVLTNSELALGTYRRSVSSIIPKMTQVAWEWKKDEIQRLIPTATYQRFVFNLSRAEYEKQWGEDYDEPGFFVKFVGLLLRIVPKIGLFKALSFKILTPEAEELFMKSFNATLDAYRTLIDRVQAGRLDLKNNNLDLGRPSPPGEYETTDAAYAKLLDRLAENRFEKVTPDLRADIIAFYGILGDPVVTKKKKKSRRKTIEALTALRAKQ